MTMKKKLTVTTLAASLVLGSFAGLPLSDKGIASKLGLGAGIVSATASLPNADLLAKLNAIHTELARDAEGIAAVNDARDAVNALTLNSSQKEALLGDIWTGITGKNGFSNSGLTVDTVYAVISQLAFSYDSLGADILTSVTDPIQRETVDKLAKLTGLTGGLNDISLSDVSAFYEAVIAALKENAGSIVLAANITGGSPDFAATKQALANVINTKVLTSNSLTVSRFLSGLGISVGDINDLRMRFAVKVDPQNKATTALEGAFFRYMLSTVLNSGYTQTISNSGRTLTPTITLYNNPIPADMLEWAFTTEHTNVSISTNGSSFVLSNSATSASNIGVAAIALGVKVYIGTISMTAESTPTPSPSPGPGSGPGSLPAVTPAVNEGAIVSAAKEELNKLKDQLKDAAPEKKNEIIAQATANVIEAIKQITNIDLSATITIVGEKATPKLNVSDLVKQFKEINTQAKALNDQLKGLDPNAKKAKVELTLNLGKVDAKTTEVPLAKELLQAAKDNGVDTIAILLNGLGLSVNPNEFKEDTKLAVTKRENTVATSATQLSIASDVYEFEFTSGGNAITSFSTPVSLSIPVTNTIGMDTELLSLAKILDGKLIFFGGKYKDGKLDATRNGFSTYTVVENKVSFTDNSSVQAWAGRQIQVAAAKGILEGRGEQTFVPNGQVTRAEFAKMIVKTFGIEDAAATENFNDVSDSDWYKVYVASAVKNGIVNGRAEGKFDPNGLITRAEMATMAARALTLAGSVAAVSDVNAALKGFTDVTGIDASLKSGVALAANEGIVIGEEGGKFNPNADSTRAQAAVVIYRLLNK